MPVRPIAYVDQPYAGKRHTPDTSRLAALYSRGGEQLADIALQRGQNSARLFDRLGALFSGYHELEQQKKATAAATVLRQKEKTDERSYDAEQKRLERQERADERKIVREDSKRSEDRGAARYMVDNTKAGPVDGALAELAMRFPETAARFTRQTTLPATVTPGALGEVGAPEYTGQAILHPSADDAARADTLAAQQTRWKAEDAARAKDDDRAERSLAATISNQEAMRRIAQQNANTTANNAQARLGGGSGTLTPQYRNALERVIGNIPANRRGPKVAHAERLLNEQNETELKDFIRLNAIESEGMETRNQITGRQATIASLNDTTAILRELKAKGADTGWFTGTAEDLYRKMGKTTNPELVALRNRLAGTLINYRKAATGSGFGQQEGEAYEKMFPNYKNDLPVNEALINGLMREMRTYDGAYWEHKLGKDGAALIIGSSPASAGGVTVLSITPVGGKR